MKFSSSFLLALINLQDTPTTSVQAFSISNPLTGKLKRLKPPPNH